MTGDETVWETVDILTKDGDVFQYKTVIGHDVVPFGESWFFVFESTDSRHFISVSDILSAKVTTGGSD